MTKKCGECGSSDTHLKIRHDGCTIEICRACNSWRWAFLTCPECGEQFLAKEAFSVHYVDVHAIVKMTYDARHAQEVVL